MTLSRERQDRRAPLGAADAGSACEPVRAPVPGAPVTARSIIDAWKQDRRLHMTPEVKRLIGEIEAGLEEERARISDRDEPLRDWGWE